MYVLAGVLWGVGLGAGFHELSAFSQKPGAVGAPAESLPPELRAGRNPARSLVVVALHPRCSCSSATADELGDLLGWTPEAFDLAVLSFVPAQGGPDWPEPKAPGPLARFRPRIVADADGRLAERLGARTSGHVLVYDGADRLVFSGGVTPGRGHRGETAGQKTLRDFLSGRMDGAEAAGIAPVFGCAIQDAETVTLP
jgi:hypothetical protein